MITQKELKELLTYTPETGVFRWNKDRNHLAKRGEEAGCYHTSRCNKTYVIIRIRNKSYYAQQLAFLYMTGEFANEQVDHISGDSSDNSWSNLREVSARENQRNARLRCDNKIGLTGVNMNNGFYVARISNGERREYLGRFDNLLDAACARKSAERKYGFHVNHGRKTNY